MGSVIHVALWMASLLFLGLVAGGLAIWLAPAVTLVGQRLRQSGDGLWRGVAFVAVTLLFGGFGLVLGARYLLPRERR